MRNNAASSWVTAAVIITTICPLAAVALVLWMLDISWPGILATVAIGALYGGFGLFFVGRESPRFVAHAIQETSSMEMTELPAGRKLDARVAETIMGYTHIIRCSQWKEGELQRGDWWATPPAPCEMGRRLPYYSTDLGTAWEILEKLQAQGWHWEVSDLTKRSYAVTFMRGGFDGTNWDEEFLGFGESVPLAICRAALTIRHGGPAHE